MRHAIRPLRCGALLLAAGILGACGTHETPPSQPPVPVKLGFLGSPTPSTAGAIITPPIQVIVQDGFGNRVFGATNTVTIVLEINSVGATLSGTTTTNAVDGIATFSNLSIDKASGFTFTATSAGLTSVTSALFAITAPAPPPSALNVSVTTTGLSLPSTYLLSIDCDSYGCFYSQSIGTNTNLTVPVPAGSHFVELVVPDNCTVTGNAQRDVTASGPTDVAYAVTCAAVGAVKVTATTTGTDIDPDSYSVCIDRAANNCYWSGKLPPSGAISISSVTAASHVVSLTNIGGNCVVSGGAAQTVAVVGSGSVDVHFDVSCVLAERIAFASNGSISMIHTDGTGARVITPGGAPSWSADGTRLAYSCSGICITNADGTSSTQMNIAGVSPRDPTWSPDGQKIAFATGAQGTSEIDVVSLGGGIAHLATGLTYAGKPAWSPDGTQIAFDCEIDVGNFDICAVHADGSGLTRLTNDAARDYGAAWKPDGSALAFSTTRFGLDEIVLANPSGANVTRIGAGLPGFAPTWSPDGTQLAFVQLFNDPFAGPYGEIMAAHLDGSNVLAVTRGLQPAWKPHR